METTEAIWEGVLRLFEKIKAISNELEWPELLTMVTDQVFKSVDKDTADERLLEPESFLMRACLRYEYADKGKFNVVSMCSRCNGDAFRIANYDYNTYLWAKKIYDQEIDNNCIYIPYGKLKPEQIEALKKKAVNN